MKVRRINIRRCLSGVLALCLCISMMAGCGKETNSGGDMGAEPSTEPTQREETPVEEFTYEMVDGEVIITGYTGVAREIYIPEEINERPVTQIGEEAFAEYDLTLIDIPDTVKIIHKEAFDDCNCLVDVRLPDGLERIERFAFNSCDALKTVEIPEGLQFLGYGSFANTGIKRLELPCDFAGFEIERSVLSFEIDEDGNRTTFYADMIQNPFYNSDTVLVVEEGSEALKQIELYGYNKINYEIKKKDTQGTGEEEVKNEEQSGNVTVYLLKAWETYNESGEVLDRERYTYNDRGLVLTMDWDRHGGVEVWNEQLEVFQYDMLPCDGVIDWQAEYSYDENGMLSSFDDGLNPACEIEYTYDTDGRLIQYALLYSSAPNMSAIEYELKYDDEGNVTEVWTGSRLWMEYGYDGENRVNECVIHHREYESIGGLTHLLEYDEEGRVIHSDRGLLAPLNCSYHEDGYLESINGFTFSYENGMLSAIGDRPVELEKDSDGNLTLEVDNSKLYYEAVVLSGKDAALARYTWNQLYGSPSGGHTGVQFYYLFGIRWPYYELDTQLMLPSKLWFT